MAPNQFLLISGCFCRSIWSSAATTNHRSMCPFLFLCSEGSQDRIGTSFAIISESLSGHFEIVDWCFSKMLGDACNFVENVLVLCVSIGLLIIENVEEETKQRRKRKINKNLPSVSLSACFCSPERVCEAE